MQEGLLYFVLVRPSFSDLIMLAVDNIASADIPFVL